MRAALATLFTAALLSSTAEAAVRSYFQPSIEGERLAFCASTGKDCGKPVADAWCRFNGYEASILYQRDQISSSSKRVLFADTGTACDGASCLSFREIKCRGEG